MSVGSFSSTSVKIPSLHFERVNVLLNLGAAHSAMAVQTRRADEEGIKASIASCQVCRNSWHLYPLLVLTLVAVRTQQVASLISSRSSLHSPPRPMIYTIQTSADRRLRLCVT